MAKSEAGLTAMELVIATAISGIVMLALAAWMRSGFGAFRRAASRQTLLSEAANAAELLTGFLRRADNGSVTIKSSPAGPWSDLEFVAGPHHYAFLADGHRLLFVSDELAPKVLSAHLLTLQFSLARPRLPTLLNWAIMLGETNAGAEPPVTLSGKLFLRESSE